MNDITALALLVSKAKASVFTMKYISQFEADDIDSDDVDLRFEVDGVETGTNVSIVDECGQAAQMITALVEALEKAQQKVDVYDMLREDYGLCEKGVGLADFVDWQAKRIAELESRTVTVKLPEPLMPAQHNSGELFMTTDNVIQGGYLNRDDVLRNLRAAGIQVIEGEQKNG